MPGIWGDGQRGGIFGAKVDPRLQAELERRAAAKRQEMATAQEPSLADQWHGSLANRILSAPSKLFGGLVVDPAMDLATLAGDVIHGRQPTMAADPRTGEFHTDPRLADRAMNAAGMLTLGAGAVPAEANSLRMGIKAYHGSPHDFERFDSSKIGTGEGAQAYGHGMYFAEREGVAKDYRNKLAPSNLDDVSPDAVAQAKFGPEWQKLVDELRPARERRDRLYHTGEYQLDSGADEFQQLDKRIGEGDAQLDALHKQMVDDTVARNPHLLKGRMYEVDIAADPEHFLDWDKPLSEQSPQVREKLLQTGDPAKVKALEAEHRQAYDDYMSRPETTSTGDLHRMERRVEQTYDAWRKEIGNAAKSGAGVYSELAGGGKFATGTEKLKERGIPGIKYLDQGSRPNVGRVDMLRQQLATLKERNASAAAIKNTEAELADAEKTVSHNFVVFDDKLISILKKYGLPISAAGLAALSQLHPQEAQAAQKQKGR